MRKLRERSCEALTIALDTEDNYVKLPCGKPAPVRTSDGAFYCEIHWPAVCRMAAGVDVAAARLP